MGFVWEEDDDDDNFCVFFFTAFSQTQLLQSFYSFSRRFAVFTVD